MTEVDAFSSILSVHADGIRLSVKAKPGLSRPRPPRIVPIGDDLYALEVTVAAPPEDGKANAALCEQLAKWLGVKKNAVSLHSGGTGRIKVIHIEGNGAVLQVKVHSLFG